MGEAILALVLLSKASVREYCSASTRVQQTCITCKCRSLKVIGLTSDRGGNSDCGNKISFDLNCGRCGKYHIAEHSNDSVDVTAINIAKQINSISPFL